MLSTLAPVLVLLIPALAGYLAHILFDYVDDDQQWTAKLPPDVKRLVVMLLAWLATYVNQRWGISLPTSPLTEPGVQALIASVVAFFLKHASPPDTP